jgi:hypothetical protein
MKPIIVVAVCLFFLSLVLGIFTLFEQDFIPAGKVIEMRRVIAARFNKKYFEIINK